MKTTPPPELQVGYAVGRDMIKSGDILSFFASHEEGFLHRIVTSAILWFTGSRIFHSGVALWITTEGGERRLMLVESVGVGRRLVNLSKFEDHKFEVHRIPPEVDEKKVEQFLLNGLTLGYGFWNLIAIGIREFFGMQAKATKSLVCSEAAIASWQAGGFVIDDIVISPGKLRNVLSERGIPPTLMINPDSGN